jgi:hypothetical protein
VIATEGALAILTVYVTGNPSPDVYWRKGKKDITNVGKYRIVEGGNLQVRVKWGWITSQGAIQKKYVSKFWTF